MSAFRLFVLGAVLVSASCSAATWNAGLQGFAQGYAAGGVAAPAKLMLFGGPGHRTYLGCLNCSDFDADSARNEFGSHGSAYATDSVVNKYSQFGSRYGLYSPCNPYATDPPVIVDGAGSFYGRLTINRYHHQQTRNSQILAWIAAVCAG